MGRLRTQAEEEVLKRISKGSARMEKMLKLEVRLQGFSEKAVNTAIRQLKKEGAIYVCRSERYIKKV